MKEMYKTREEILDVYPCFFNVILDIKAQTWGFEDGQAILNYFRKDLNFLKHLRIEKIKVVLDEREEFEEDDLLIEFIKEIFQVFSKIN